MKTILALLGLVALLAALALALGYMSSYDAGSFGEMQDPDVRANSPPLASRLTVTVLRSHVNAVYLPEATVRVSNSSIEYVDAVVRCDFFDAAGSLVADGEGRVRNIAPGADATGTVMSADQYVRPRTVNCQVSDARVSR